MSYSPLNVGATTDYERHGTHLAPFEAERRIYPTTVSNTQLGVVPRTLIDLKNSHSSISSQCILSSYFRCSGVGCGQDIWKGPEGTWNVFYCDGGDPNVVVAQWTLSLFHVVSTNCAKECN